MKLKRKAVETITGESSVVIDGLNKSDWEHQLFSPNTNNNGNAKRTYKPLREYSNTGSVVVRNAKGQLVKGSAAPEGAGRKPKAFADSSKEQIKDRINYMHRKLMQAFLKTNEEGESVLNHLIRTRPQESMALLQKIVPESTAMFDARLDQQTGNNGNSGAAIVVSINAGEKSPALQNTKDIDV